MRRHREADAPEPRRPGLVAPAARAAELATRERVERVIDFLDRNDPKKTNKPFFVWYNPARMHITTMLSDKYMAMVGTKGGKDWGANEAAMKSALFRFGPNMPTIKSDWDLPAIGW